MITAVRCGRRQRAHALLLQDQLRPLCTRISLCMLAARMPALPSAPRRRACSPRARPCTTARAGSTVLHACSVAGSECRVVIGQGIRTFGQELKAWHHLFVNRRADRTPCAAPKRSPILLWRTFLQFSPTTTKNVLFDGVATLTNPSWQGPSFECARAEGRRPGGGAAGGEARARARRAAHALRRVQLRGSWPACWRCVRK